jgi:hypothetical protein
MPSAASVGLWSSGLERKTGNLLLPQVHYNPSRIESGVTNADSSVLVYAKPLSSPGGEPASRGNRYGSSNSTQVRPVL